MVDIPKSECWRYTGKICCKAGFSRSLRLIWKAAEPSASEAYTMGSTADLSLNNLRLKSPSVPPSGHSSFQFLMTSSSALSCACIIAACISYVPTSSLEKFPSRMTFRATSDMYRVGGIAISEANALHNVVLPLEEAPRTKMARREL